MSPKVLLLLGALVAAGVTIAVLVAGDSDTGTIIFQVETEPAGQAGSFSFTGVPTGTISSDATLVVADLDPGTYTSTEVDPSPDFDVTAVECDDDESATPSGGDPGARTAVLNLDAGETVTCTFTNTQRGALIIASQTEPEASAGSFQFTGVPTGTIPSNGTLVVADIRAGTYTSTERDPSPEFDVTDVSCDDEASPNPSSGDPGSRTAVFNLDPGETVTCTFTNTRRATAVVAADMEGASANFQFTGVPSGTVSNNGTLVVANLTPGTYTTTGVDPAPNFEFTSVICDDSESAVPSSGDAATRTAVFNLDPGETVTCTFSNDDDTGNDIVGGGETDTGTIPSGDGINPFVDPDDDFDQFPLPEDPNDLPDDAGTHPVPRPGPWTAHNHSGGMECGSFEFEMAPSPPESGEIEVLDDGATVIATGLEESADVSITMTADPAITGRYYGSFGATQDGVPIVIDYYWQLVTDEHIVGYLTSSFSSEGVTCSIYRPFELFYTG